MLSAQELMIIMILIGIGTQGNCFVGSTMAQHDHFDAKVLDKFIANSPAQLKQCLFICYECPSRWAGLLEVKFSFSNPKRFFSFNPPPLL